MTGDGFAGYLDVAADDPVEIAVKAQISKPSLKGAHMPSGDDVVKTMADVWLNGCAPALKTLIWRGDHVHVASGGIDQP